MSSDAFDTVSMKIVVVLVISEIRTIQNLEFTYEISGDVLIPSRTEYNLSKSDVGKILERIPLKGPGEISNDVRGPSYLWAILHDSRISNDEW